MDYQKELWWGFGSIHLVVDWMEAYLNAILRLIVRKGRGLCRPNDWKSPACVTREKSVISVEDRVMTF